MRKIAALAALTALYAAPAIASTYDDMTSKVTYQDVGVFMGAAMVCPSLRDKAAAIPVALKELATRDHKPFSTVADEVQKEALTFVERYQAQDATTQVKLCLQLQVLMEKNIDAYGGEQ